MLTVHLIAVALALLMVLLADKEALAYMRGKSLTITKARAKLYHVITWIILLTLIGSGLWLLLPRWQYEITNPLFIVKMLFVGILLTNAFLIGRLMEVAFVKPWATLTEDEKLPLVMSGMISGFSWLATVIVAFFAFS